VIELEPLVARHVPGVQLLVDDPVAIRFTRIPEPPPPGFAEAWLARYEQGRRDGTREAFAIVEDGAFLGLALAPHIDRETATVELGYIVAERRAAAASRPRRCGSSPSGRSARRGRSGSSC
jgi:hypothetical protein